MHMTAFPLARGLGIEAVKHRLPVCRLPCIVSSFGPVGEIEQFLLLRPAPLGALGRLLQPPLLPVGRQLARLRQKVRCEGGQFASRHHQPLG